MTGKRQLSKDQRNQVTINYCPYYFLEAIDGPFKETTDITEIDKASTSKPEEDNMKTEGKIFKHL